MKLSLAQTFPFRADINRNINQHISLIETAIECESDLILFPELSLTGYEPQKAENLSLSMQDQRLKIFQELADRNNLILIIGAPVRIRGNIIIGSLIFKPDSEIQLYQKQYLHPDEEKCFTNGINESPIIHTDPRISLAICYEISLDDHLDSATKGGSQVYLASVAKTKSGVEEASNRLSLIAKNYSIPVLMANCCGPSEEGICAGLTAVWDNSGERVATLDESNPGILTYDILTGKTLVKNITIDSSI